VFHTFYTLFESRVLAIPSPDRLRVLTYKQWETRHHCLELIMLHS